MKTLIPRLLALLTLLTLTPLARADEVRIVRRFETGEIGVAYQNLQADSGPIGVVWSTGRVEFQSALPLAKGPTTIKIVELDNPEVRQAFYSMDAEVSYENVEGRAYFELLSDFADGTRSRVVTLDEAGPAKPISGSSVTRPVILPAVPITRGRPPGKLTLNLVMPGPGKVTIRRLLLFEKPFPGTAPASAANASDAPPLTIEQRMIERRRLARATTQATPSPADPRPSDDNAPAINGRTTIADLPPEVAMAVRRQFSEDLVAAIKQRDFMQGLLDWANEHLAAGETQAYITGDKRTSGDKMLNLAEAKRDYEQNLHGLDKRIATLKAVLAEPLPTAAPPPPAGVVAWLGRHSAYVFASGVAVMLLAVLPLRLLMQRGRGRTVVLGFFGLMLAGGVGQLFAAGVVLGMGRPADAWATLLGGSAILIVCGGLLLRQARAHYAGVELRKLRAMDVG